MSRNRTGYVAEASTSGAFRHGNCSHDGMGDPVERVTNDDFRAVYESPSTVTQAPPLGPSRNCGAFRGNIIRSAHQHDFVPLQRVLQRFGSR